jgi:hypothetical protein
MQFVLRHRWITPARSPPIQITSTHSNILETLGSNDNIVRYYERFVDKPNNIVTVVQSEGDLSQVSPDDILGEDAVRLAASLDHAGS